MTKQDLRLEYKRETGEYPSSSDSFTVIVEDSQTLDYINWLELKLLELWTTKKK
jgi:hypothetical protein